MRQMYAQTGQAMPAPEMKKGQRRLTFFDGARLRRSRRAVQQVSGLQRTMTVHVSTAGEFERGAQAVQEGAQDAAESAVSGDGGVGDGSSVHGLYPQMCFRLSMETLYSPKRYRSNFDFQSPS
jgi:hypothetical protein